MSNEFENIMNKWKFTEEEKEVVRESKTTVTETMNATNVMASIYSAKINKRLVKVTSRIQPLSATNASYGVS